MNRPTQILFTAMLELVGNKEPDWWSPYEVFSGEAARDFWNTMLQESPECYDEDWFPVVAVVATNQLVDYDLLGAAWTASWWTQCDRYAAEGRLPVQRARQNDQNDPQPCC